jgi:hypothetical protein
VSIDGVIRYLDDITTGDLSNEWEKTTDGAIESMKECSEFVLEQPPWPFKGNPLFEHIIQWPGARSIKL